MKLLLFLSLIGFCLGIQSAVAEGGHGHGHEHNHEAAIEPAPHGGILRDAPPYKTELVLDKDTARIYVYDSAVQPVSKDALSPKAVGQLAFPKDRTKKEVIFTLVGDAYQAIIPAISKAHRYDLHVELTIKGKKVIGDFGVDNIH